MPMRKRALSLLSILSALGLVACGPQEPPVDIDPQLGRDCLELHLPSLPPGTQFEGVTAAQSDQLTIRVMTGVELTTLDCRRGEDGAVIAAMR
jgi:hypothetical protein